MTATSSGTEYFNAWQACKTQNATQSVIGKAGGIAPGPYDPLKCKNPEGLTVLDGLVWVTENDRWEPKRFGAFDITSGAMKHEFFGPTNYGAQGAGFDQEDETQWIGQGTLFELDFEKKSASPLTVGNSPEVRSARVL